MSEMMLQLKRTMFMARANYRIHFDELRCNPGEFNRLVATAGPAKSATYFYEFNCGIPITPDPLVPPGEVWPYMDGKRIVRNGPESN